GTASLSRSSSSVSNTGAECANSGKTTRRTGKNGAAPPTAESIIDKMRSVFGRIWRRSTGFAKSVWHAATEYLISSILTSYKLDQRPPRAAAPAACSDAHSIGGTSVTTLRVL